MGILEAYDLGMFYWFENLHRPWLTPAVRALTRLGDWYVLTAVTALAAAGFAAARRARAAAAVVGAALAAWGLKWAVQHWVGRPRPDVLWRLIELPSQPSFPSGHATSSMAIYGAIGLLWAKFLRRGVARDAVAGVGVLLGLVVGLTRVYLGVHYPLDVVAGWCGGLMLALLAAEVGAPAPQGGSAPLPSRG